MDINESLIALRNKILELRGVDVAPKTVTHDLFLVPSATELTRQKIFTSFVSGLQSFDSISNMLQNESFLDQVAETFGVTITDVTSLIADALDKLAANYNITRRDAVAATGIVNFFRPNALSESELTKTIATGTIVYTNGGIEYKITTNVSYSTYYYDPTMNMYVIDAPVECTTPGTVGNVPAGVITNISTPVEGFSSVTNKDPITNGIDIESTLDFAARLKYVITGSNVGTADGIANIILSNIPITDLIVVGPGDPMMTRDLGWGGKVDVYILEKSLVQTTWNFNYNGEDITYIEGNRPVTATNITSSEGSFTFTPDTTTDYKGSVKSKDYITWTTKPTPPYPKIITLTYYYDKNIKDAQDLINQDKYNTGADVLIKQSTEVPIDIIFELVVLAGYSKATVINEVTTILTQKIDSLKLGKSVEQADVIDWIYSVTGVDRIILPMTKFNRSSSTGTVNVITTSKNEYLRLSILKIS